MSHISLHDLPFKYQDQVSKQIYSRGAPPSSIVEQSSGHGPLGKRQTEKTDSAIYQVRVVSFRVRLCDEDNLAEKYHVDALRYLKLIPDDSPDKCHIITTQQKVLKKKDQRTEITVSKL